MAVFSRVVLPALAVFVLGASTGAPPPSATAAPRTDADLAFIIAEAQRVQIADVEAWNLYRFERVVERAELDEAGRVVERRETAHVVTPGQDGFREDLILVDGRPPSGDEKKRDRRTGGFNKHYQTMISGTGGEEEEGGYSLGQFLHLSTYRLAGRETREGVACYRLDFSPDPSGEDKSGLAARIAGVMQGSLWITVEGFHLAAASARTVRPISLAFFLSKVYDVEVGLESQSVGEGVWLPRLLRMQTRARFLIKPIRRRHVYLYSDFQRIAKAEHEPSRE